MVTYFTDTDTDITPAEAQKYGYKLISMPYSAEGKTVYPYVDFEKFDCKGFYDTLRGGVMPVTSALTKEAYIEYFEPEFKAGNDIFYVHFSAAMTATFDFMKLGLNELKEKYPERKFYEVDTKGITICSYNAVCEIGDLILKGATPEEILEWASTGIDKVATYFFADDLKFFARSGRVSGIAATMGNLFGVRPILTMDENGVMKSVGKERGRDNAINRLVEYVETLGEDLENHRFIIGHSDALPLVEKIKEKLIAKFGDKLNFVIVEVNPTAGSHCGPSTLGIRFHAKHR